MISNSDYLKLVSELPKSENELRSIIQQLAKENGYDSPILYHGTKDFGFLKIDTSKSDDRISFFATDNLEVAKTYTRNKEIASPLSTETLDYAIIEIEDELRFELDSAIDDIISYIEQSDYEAYWNIDKESMVDDSLDYIKDELYKHTPNAIHYANEIAEMIFQSFFDQADLDIDTDEIIDTISNIVAEYEEGIKDLCIKLEHYNNVLYNGGIYQFYANLDGMLQIDARKTLWNKIDLTDIYDSYVEFAQSCEDTHDVNNATTRDLAKFVQSKGYTGVIIKNLFDTAHGSRELGNIYIFLNPSKQLKSADLVTYDDDGRIYDLKWRFNTNSDDIRETLEEDITKINNTDEIQTEVTSSHDNQLDAYMVYIRNGQVLGGLTYYEYEEEPYIGMIEVEKEYRNQGIGTALMKHLQSLYPNTPIHTGYRTADGTEFFKKILIKQYNSEYANLKKELELCTTRLKEIDDEFEMFAKKDSYSPAEFSHMEKVDEEQFELLHRQQELIDKLDEMSEYDEFVKMENLKEEFTKIDTNVVDGLNFRDKSGKLLDKVFSGEKEFETRDYTDSSTHGALPKSYLNRKIGIIQTANGKAKLVGYWELGNGEDKDYEWLDNHRKEIGNDDTEFDIVMGDKKWVYPIKWAKQLKTPIEINSKGIRSRKINYHNAP